MASKDSIHMDLRRLEERPFPKFKRPQELAMLSTAIKAKENSSTADHNPETWWSKYTMKQLYKRTLHSDATAHRMQISESSLLGSINFDLSYGHGTQTQKERENEYISILLECLIRNKQFLDDFEFVCWRGLLTKISASPYEAGGRFDDGMTIVAQRMNGVFYMCEFPTQQALLKEKESTDQQKLMQYWGMKFESYVTAKPGQAPTPDIPMDFNSEFGSIVGTKLGSHSLLYGGEVDCCFPSDNKRYVELKTSREFEHRGQERSFRKFKLIKWWLQSFMIGINDILCGFRDDAGFVKSFKWYKVSDIPRILKQDQDHCRPSVCFAFLDSFLHFVKANVLTELKPHVITRKPGETSYHLSIDENGQHRFLPHWFVNQVIVDTSNDVARRAKKRTFSDVG